jgi:hypothetical protein
LGFCHTNVGLFEAPNTFGAAFAKISESFID